MRAGPLLLILLVTIAGTVFLGCSSPSPEPGPAIYPGDQILGTWNWMSRGQSNIQASYTFTADARFSRHDQKDSTVDDYSGTWSKTNSNTYALVYKGRNPGFDSENMYYLNQTGYLRNEVNDLFQKAS